MTTASPTAADLDLDLKGRRDDLDLRLLVLCACMMYRMEARPPHIDPGCTSIDGDGQRDASLPRTSQALPTSQQSPRAKTRHDRIRRSRICSPTIETRRRKRECTVLSGGIGSGTRYSAGDLARLQEPRVRGRMFCACISQRRAGRGSLAFESFRIQMELEDAHRIDPWRALVYLLCTTPAVPRATPVPTSPSLRTVPRSPCPSLSALSRPHPARVVFVAHALSRAQLLPPAQGIHPYSICIVNAQCCALDGPRIRGARSSGVRTSGYPHARVRPSWVPCSAYPRLLLRTSRHPPNSLISMVRSAFPRDHTQFLIASAYDPR
ncbi:hypothetical protein B0H13DRAFT_871201 [Mycena leptocephala]|nr:hypothetical protein B0H13DRAFT_871201 [Mycena leptocephala]